jgi:hypothetical protein
MIACSGCLVNHKFSSPLRGRAVGLGDQFEQVAVGVVEIDAAAIEVVDLTRPLAAEVRVVRDAGGVDARECGVELGFADQEGIMIRRRNGGWNRVVTLCGGDGYPNSPITAWPTNSEREPFPACVL